MCIRDRSYCQGANITVDESWELAYPVYEKIMVIATYQDSLYQEYASQNSNAATLSFHDYYEQYQETLMEQYTVCLL